MNRSAPVYPSRTPSGQEFVGAALACHRRQHLAEGDPLRQRRPAALHAPGRKAEPIHAAHQHGEAVAESLGDAATFVPMDIRREQDWAAAVDAAHAFGPLNVLVNNAAVVHFSSIVETTLEDYKRVIDINQVGTFLGMRSVFDPMKEAGGGSIVNTASVAALGAAPKMSIYAASKHAVLGLTRSVAVEYAKQGIRVNAVCPAVIDTDMFRRAAAIEPRKAEFAAAMHPVGRIGRAEEIAAAVMYLCGENSGFTTGIALPVDGGSTCI